jgi:hypothetical protein
MLGRRWETHGVPFVKKQGSWEIDIYVGDTPFTFAPPRNGRNPVITANDVTDIRAYFVADPFMLREDETWFMFFEALNRQTQRGEIALAKSRDGFKWEYQQIVLAESFHLSYPYVFEWQREHYMIPESFEAGTIRLYKAVEFPTKWVFVGNLREGEPYVDSSLFRVGKLWWLFTSRPTNDELRLFYADRLTGSWVEHPLSPVVQGDASVARPGGRVLVFDGRVIRYTQDCAGEYGRQLRAFEVCELTTSTYRERKVSDNPVTVPKRKIPRRIHHIDPHRLPDGRWIACADSFRKGPVFGLRY